MWNNSFIGALEKMANGLISARTSIWVGKALSALGLGFAAQKFAWDPLIDQAVQVWNAVPAQIAAWVHAFGFDQGISYLLSAYGIKGVSRVFPAAHGESGVSGDVVVEAEALGEGAWTRLRLDDVEKKLTVNKRKSDAIGDTASITLLTGLPGSGKSLRIVQYIVNAVAQGEHVFVCNITDLDVPGVTAWEDPRKWQDLPVGAILIVDEAQDFFPERRGGEPAPYMRELSRVRHYGVRLVLATQQPNYLDTYLRGLVGFHEHLLRVNGKQQSFIFRNQTVMDVVRQAIKVIKGKYDHERWDFPAKYFRYYKSAQLHTVRYRMPSLLKKALVVAPIAALMFGAAWFFIFRDGYKQAYGEGGAPKESTPPASSTGAPPSTGAATPQGKQGWRTAGEYAQALTPMVEGMPWTAPAFVNRPIVSKPDVFCVVTAAGRNDQGEWQDSKCQCYSEQATRYALSDSMCIRYATGDRPYNPYVAPEQARAVGERVQADKGSRASGTETDAGRVAGDSTGIHKDGYESAQSHYGQMRRDTIPAEPAVSGI